MKGFLTGIASGAAVAGAVAIGTLTLVPAVQVGPDASGPSIPDRAADAQSAAGDIASTEADGAAAAPGVSDEDAQSGTIFGTETAQDGAGSAESGPKPDGEVADDPVADARPPTEGADAAPPDSATSAGSGSGPTSESSDTPVAAARTSAGDSDADTPLQDDPGDAGEDAPVPNPPQPEAFDIAALPPPSSAAPSADLSGPADASTVSDAPRRPTSPAREGELVAPRLADAPPREERKTPTLQPTRPDAPAAPTRLADGTGDAESGMPRPDADPDVGTRQPGLNASVPVAFPVSPPSIPLSTRAQVRLAAVPSPSAAGTPDRPSASQAPDVSPMPAPLARPAAVAAPSPLQAAPDRPPERDPILVEERAPDPAGTAPRRTLPQVGDDIAIADPGPDLETPASSEEPAAALIRNAVPVDVPEGLPRLAIVLLDDPAAPIMAEPRLSVAIAAGAPDAATRARAWRDAGQEIVLIPALTGGTPQDVAQAMEGSLQAVPLAATVMPADDGGFPGGNETAETVVARIASSGHGLITRPSGLDGTARIAGQRDVPAQPVQRRVDGDGRDARAIARFLDGAAFDASRRGSAIVLAANTPEVRAALDAWLDGTRVQGVALVPISALLRDDG